MSASAHCDSAQPRLQQPSQVMQRTNCSAGVDQLSKNPWHHPSQEPQKIIPCLLTSLLCYSL